MAEYTVIVPFTDLRDNNHVYRAGDVYPRPGVVVGDARINHLATTDNKRGKPLIKMVKAPEKPVEKPVEKTAEKTNEKTYSKSEIMRMPVAQLRKLAKKNGLKDPEEYIGSELKQWLIDKLNL